MTEEPKAKEEFDADPRYNGQRTETCDICHLEILPRGRSATIGMIGCEHKRGSDLWPNESREDFGYPKWLAADAARLRAKFYPDAEVEDYSMTEELKSATTHKEGDWDDPATWGDGPLPTETDNIVIKHKVSVGTRTNVKGKAIKMDGAGVGLFGRPEPHVPFRERGIKWSRRSPKPKESTDP